MTKRPKRSKKPTTFGVIVALIIAVIAALQSAQKTSAPASTPVATIATQIIVTASAVPATQSSGATALPTVMSAATSAATRVLPTNLPRLEITPISGALYEVTGSVNALGCPDTRCKVIDVYKKDSVIVVTGMVMGTTYKTKKTRLWYQVIYHDGSRVYIHGSYVKPHEN
jgi:hypothetical protein